MNNEKRETIYRAVDALKGNQLFTPNALDQRPGYPLVASLALDARPPSAAFAGDIPCPSCPDGMHYELRPLPDPMESPRDSTGMLESALHLHRRGLRLIPLFGKQAFLKRWQHLHLGESDVRDWARKGVNFGIITGDPLVVLDTDSEEAEAWVREKKIESPVIVQSGGGGLHRYFVCPEDIELHSKIGMHQIPGLDVKAWNSYIVGAGSIHPETKQRYDYLPGKELGDLHELPVFNPAWAREIRTEPVPMPRNTDAGARVSGHIRNIRAYIRGIQSIEGSGGDKACFTVACLLAEAGFTFAEALAEIADWNLTNAFPPWATKELSRKLRYAFARVMQKR
jgi:hypothetical protein